MEQLQEQLAQGTTLTSAFALWPVLSPSSPHSPLQSRIKPGKKKKEKRFPLVLILFSLDYPFLCLFLRSRHLKFRFSSFTTMQNIRNSFTIYKLSKCSHFWALPAFQIWLRKWLWMVSVGAWRAAESCLWFPDSVTKDSEMIHYSYSMKWVISGQVTVSLWEIIASVLDKAKVRQQWSLWFPWNLKSYLKVVYQRARTQMRIDLRSKTAEVTTHSWEA